MAIISDKYKFCFTHIIKTGGTTVTILLKEQVDDLLLTNPLHSSIKNDLINFPRIKDYFKFAYVRNPYDWLVSLYSYICMFPDHPDYKYIAHLTFYQFIEWLSDVGLKRDETIPQPCYKTQTDLLFVKDKLGVDSVLKFENLCNDNNDSNLLSVFYNLHLEIPISIPLTNKSERHINWENKYNLETYKLVNKVFKDDFKNFKYVTHEY